MISISDQEKRTLLVEAYAPDSLNAEMAVIDWETARKGATSADAPFDGNALDLIGLFAQMIDWGWDYIRRELANGVAANLVCDGVVAFISVQLAKLGWSKKDIDENEERMKRIEALLRKHLDRKLPDEPPAES